MTLILATNLHAKEYDPCDHNSWQKVTLREYVCGDICFLNMTQEYRENINFLISVPCDSGYNSNLCKSFEEMDSSSQRNLYYDAYVKLKRDKNYKKPVTAEEMEADFGSCSIVKMKLISRN